MKIAFVGGKTSAIGFKPLGVETFAVPKPDEAPEVWKHVNPDDYAVIFVTEPVYAVLKEELEDLRLRVTPVITVVPSVAVSEQVGRSEMRALVERAVGTDLALQD